MASKRERIKEAAQQTAFAGTGLLNRPPSMTDEHAIQDVLSQCVRATDERDGE